MPKDVELTVEITLHRATLDESDACQGCTLPTRCGLVLVGNGEVLSLIAVCETCQAKLGDLGHDIGSDSQLYERARAAGISDKLATKIARRWGNA